LLQRPKETATGKMARAEMFANIPIENKGHWAHSQGSRMVKTAALGVKTCFPLAVRFASAHDRAAESNPPV
jgi:hypothetical protein